MNTNAEAWVRALETSRLSDGTPLVQGRGRLTEIDLHGQERNCCLGVACKLYALSHPLEAVFITALDGSTTVSYDSYDRCGIGLPRAVRVWLDLQDDEGLFQIGHKPDYLSAMNDRGNTFAEIAAVIRSEPTGLFGAKDVGEGE